MKKLVSGKHHTHRVYSNCVFSCVSLAYPIQKIFSCKHDIHKVHLVCVFLSVLLGCMIVRISSCKDHIRTAFPWYVFCYVWLNYTLQISHLCLSPLCVLLRLVWRLKLENPTMDKSRLKALFMIWVFLCLVKLNYSIVKTWSCKHHIHMAWLQYVFFYAQPGDLRRKMVSGKHRFHNVYSECVFLSVLLMHQSNTSVPIPLGKPPGFWQIVKICGYFLEGW
jgi:hypothetical protein